MAFLDYFVRVMFKLFFAVMRNALGTRVAEPSLALPLPVPLSARRCASLAAQMLGLVAGLLLSGCNTLAPLPAANLQEPGWQVRQGQMVWRHNREAPEIAGDLLVATQPQNPRRSCVQFTKGPFPLLLTQTFDNAWEARVPAENKRYSGRGTPPHRLILLYLPSLLAGNPAPSGWWWRSDQSQWQLNCPATGESLEGYLTR